MSMTNIDLTLATERAMHVRKLYHQLEAKSLGREWTVSEDMLGFFTDVGLVGRLIMATEGPWGYGGDMNAELKHKLAESLWWILVLSERLNIDISEAFSSFTNKTVTELTMSV